MGENRKNYCVCTIFILQQPRLLVCLGISDNEFHRDAHSMDSDQSSLVVL